MTKNDFLSRLMLIPNQGDYPAVAYNDPARDYFYKHDRLPYEEMQRVFFSPTPSYHDVRLIVGIILREGYETNMIEGYWLQPVGFIRRTHNSMSHNI